VIVLIVMESFAVCDGRKNIFRFMLVPVCEKSPFVNGDHNTLVPVCELSPFANGDYQFSNKSPFINGGYQLQIRPNIWLLIFKDYLSRNVTLELMV